VVWLKKAETQPLDSIHTLGHQDKGKRVPEDRFFKNVEDRLNETDLMEQMIGPC